jgi:hypothetical protein
MGLLLTTAAAVGYHLRQGDVDAPEDIVANVDSGERRPLSASIPHFSQAWVNPMEHTPSSH